MTGPTERVGFIEGPAGPLFCAITEPARVDDRGMVLSGGGWLGSGTNRNAVIVRMARAVAEEGVRAARFDWRGTGESSGQIRRFDLDEPFHGDVDAAIQELIGAGSASVIVSGICFGAWSALLAADRQPVVDQLILISLPFPTDRTKGDHKADRIGFDAAFRAAWRPAVLTELARNPAMRSAAVRTLRRKLWRSADQGLSVPKSTTAEQVPATLDRLVRRGATVDLIFGEQDLEYASYRQFVESSPLPDSVRVTVIPGDLSNFGTLAAQDSAIEAVVGALRRRGSA